MVLGMTFLGSPLPAAPPRPSDIFQRWSDSSSWRVRGCQCLTYLVERRELGDGLGLSDLLLGMHILVHLVALGLGGDELVVVLLGVSISMVNPTHLGCCHGRRRCRMKLNRRVGGQSWRARDDQPPSTWKRVRACSTDEVIPSPHLPHQTRPPTSTL